MRQAKIEEQYFTIDQFETDYVLPEGWAAGILEELIGREGMLTDGDWIESKDQDPHGDVRLIQLADIGDGYYKDKSSRFLTSEKAKELGCTFLEKGDVLVARMPEPLGRTCIFPGDPKPVVTAVDICIIRTGDDGADHRWIMQTVNSPEIRRRIESLQKGTTRKRISRRNLASLTLPTPPFNEQRRIAVKVEELLTRVNTTKKRLTKVTNILKRFRQAVLAAACSGHLTADWRSTQKELEPADHLVEHIRRKYREQYEAECSKAKREGKKLPKKPEILELRKVETAGLPEIPDEWMWIYLPALGHLSRGKSKHRPRNAPHLYGGPYPFIQTGDIAQSRGLITSHQQTYSEAGLAQSHLWPSGTICITIAANIANSAILTYPACFPDSVVGLISDKSLSLKEYAEYFIRTARSNLDQFAPSTAQKNINVDILSDLAVPLPPLAEQEEIVRRVEALFKLADTIEKRVVIATSRTEKVTQAILAKVFRGELVPTEAELARREGRSYETASELLARIKSEKEKTSPKKLLTPGVNIFLDK